MPGMTAYTGLHEIGRPQAGETLVVAAASGAVGAVVGQIAKIRGCRVVGVAGSKAKCDYVVNELGFDACLDHRAGDFAKALADACPKGIDVYWENVGGAVFEAVLPLLNRFARIPVCGLIAWYNATEPPPGPDRMPLLVPQHPDQAADHPRLHRLGFQARSRTSSGARSANGCARAGCAIARTFATGLERRRRRSWACSRAAISASC